MPGNLVGVPNTLVPTPNLVQTGVSMGSALTTQRAHFANDNLQRPTNSAEGGTNGTTVSAANSGGSSGTAWSTVTLAGTSALTYDNSTSAHGTLSYKFVFDASGSSAFMQWQSITAGAPLGSTFTETWGRFYFQMNGFGSANVILANLLNQNSQALFKWGLNSTGKIAVVIGSGATHAGATTVSTSTWYRLEFHGQFVDGVNDIAAYSLYLGDSYTALESNSYTGATLSTANPTTVLDRIRFGNSTTANQASVTYWLDDIQVNGIGVMGPGPSTFSELFSISEAATTGITQYPQMNLALTETATIGIKKQPQPLPYAVTETASVAIKQQPQKVLSVSEAASVGVTKQPNKVVAVSEAATIGLVKFPSRILSVTEIATVAIVRTIGRTFGVTETATPAVVKKPSMQLKLTETATPAVTKQPGKILSVTETATVAAAKRAGKVIAVSETASVGLARSLKKVIQVTETATLIMTFGVRTFFRSARNRGVTNMTDSASQGQQEAE